MKKKIMILDDDAHVLDFISHGLREKDFDIITARDGVQALRIARQETFNLLILDVMTPKLNSLQVCQELQKDQRTKDIPKIIMSASTKPDWPKAFEDMGVDTFLHKPFNLDELINRVECTLTRK